METKSGILLTRSHQANQTTKELIDLERFTVYSVPLIEIQPLKLKINPEEVVLNEWLFFTSSNAVTCFFKIFKSIELLKGLKIAVIGEKTAETLATYQLRADFMPTKFSAKDFISQWQTLYGGHLTNILLPKSDLARSLIKNQLENLGHQVSEKVVYRNVLPATSQVDLTELLINKKIDMALFASPSAWKRYYDVLELLPFKPRINYGAVGPITQAAIQQAGFSSQLPLGDEFTVKALLKSLAITK